MGEWGTRSPCRKKVGDAVPPRPRPTTPMYRESVCHRVGVCRRESGGGRPVSGILIERPRDGEFDRYIPGATCPYFWREAIHPVLASSQSAWVSMAQCDPGQASAGRGIDRR